MRVRRTHRYHPLPLGGWARTGRAHYSYLHVDDVARAYDVILHRGAVEEVYNIGSEDEHSVMELAGDVCRAFELDPAKAIVHVRLCA